MTTLGIDLGTTNSVAAVWRDGATVLIPNSLGHVLTPSVVSLSDDDRILVGLPARERLSTHPARTAAVFKRYMGAERQFTLGTRSFRPDELSALVLRSLRADAEAHLGERITDAVITVPAYFNDLQRRATRAAGELAGLNVLRLLTEPTAAALAYGIQVGGNEAFFLVLDLGGGTFDVSLLHCFEGIMEVRATAGDTWLGGEDFVDVIVQAFMAEVGARAGVPPVSNLDRFHGLLRRQAELAKRQLSETGAATIVVPHGDAELRWTLDRARFEQLAEPVLARIRLPIERALRDARVDPDTLSQVVLAGGATRMPMFRRLIARLFRRMPAQHINPDEVVARGAAVAAGMLSRSAGLEEVIMTDVAPFTLGISVTQTDPTGAHLHGVFLPIIERNTVIPASRAKLVTNLRDNDTRIRMDVYQGEAHLVSDNIHLGDLTVSCPPGPAGSNCLDVRFSYVQSGLIEVEATVLSTGVREAKVIEGNPGVLSPREIAARLRELSALKLHPREDVRHQALLAEARRLYEQRLGARRERIGEALTNFMASLETQDADRIRASHESLRRILDADDDGFFL